MSSSNTHLSAKANGDLNTIGVRFVYAAGASCPQFGVSLPFAQRCKLSTELRAKKKCVTRLQTRSHSKSAAMRIAGMQRAPHLRGLCF